MQETWCRKQHQNSLSGLDGRLRTMSSQQPHPKARQDAILAGIHSIGIYFRNRSEMAVIQQAGRSKLEKCFVEVLRRSAGKKIWVSEIKK